MPAAESPEEDKKRRTVNRRRRQAVAGALAAVGLILLGAWLFRTYGWKKAVPPPTANTIGVIDLQKAAEAHSAYAQLKELRSERAALAADLQMDFAAGAFQAPQLDMQPFDDAAVQKQQLALAGKHAELSQSMKEAERAKREETRPAYEAQKKALDEDYLNEILNIRIKLDSARAMRLSPADVESLAARMEELQHERGSQQQALWENYEAGIHAYMQQLAGQSSTLLQQYAASVAGEQQTEALRRQAEAQDRSSAAMESQRQGSGDRAQRLLTKKTALAAKDEEIRVLEEHIYQDISGRAAKLAIIHHLTLILANPVVNLRGLAYEKYQAGPWTEGHTLLIGTDTLDLTDAVIAELQSAG